LALTTREEIVAMNSHSHSNLLSRRRQDIIRILLNTTTTTTVAVIVEAFIVVVQVREVLLVMSTATIDRGQQHAQMLQNLSLPPSKWCPNL